MVHLGDPGEGISGSKNIMIDLTWHHLAGVYVVDVVIHKDTPIKVAVQDETRDTVNEDLGKKETGKIPGENLTDHPPNNVF